MTEYEIKIFSQRQEKKSILRGYFVHELLGVVPQAFISQVEEVDKKIDQQLRELRGAGYLSGTINIPEETI